MNENLEDEPEAGAVWITPKWLIQGFRELDLADKMEFLDRLDIELEMMGAEVELVRRDQK